MSTSSDVYYLVVLEVAGIESRATTTESRQGMGVMRSGRNAGSQSTEDVQLKSRPHLETNRQRATNDDIDM